MENLRLRDKVLEIISKNPKISKSTAAIALATILASTPIMANVNAESADASNDEEITLVTQDSNLRLTEQEAAVFNMTLEDYENGVINAYKELSKHIKYDHMMADVQSAYYLVNYEYISADLTKTLIEKNYITANNMFDASGKPSKEDKKGWINIDNTNSLVNAINDHNEATIHIDYLANAKDINHLIDPSVLCADEHDRRDLHELFELWFNAYNLEKGSITGNKEFEGVHKYITQLNSTEKKAQVYDTSTGVRWWTWKTMGNESMQFLRDYLFENYKNSELDPYFQADELRKNQLKLRDDFEINRDCATELEYIVVCFGEETKYVLDEINKAFFTLLRDDEVNREKTSSLYNVPAYKQARFNNTFNPPVQKQARIAAEQDKGLSYKKQLKVYNNNTHFRG